MEGNGCVENPIQPGGQNTLCVHFSLSKTAFIKTNAERQLKNNY